MRVLAASGDGQYVDMSDELFTYWEVFYIRAFFAYKTS